jgi:hypothetical protein
VRQHREELLAPAYAFLKILLGPATLRHVEERDDGADDLVVAQDRMTPLFGWE